MDSLKNPIIQSSARSSISNFLVPKEFDPPKIFLLELMQIFQENVLLIFQNKDTIKDVRDLIFYNYYLKNHDIMSSEELIKFRIK